MTSTLLHDDRVLLPSATRADLRDALQVALERRTGLAAAKIGVSEQAWLALPFLLERCSDERQRAAVWAMVRQHSQVQSGVFPTDRDALLEFSQWHAAAVRNLDFLGVVQGRLEADLYASLGLTSRTLSLADLEPDRSIPDRSDDCYLPVLEGRRILLVSSIARLLAERADEATFEAVWAKTGKRWFHPAEVLACEFPFTYDASTQARFGTSQNLFAAIAERIDPSTFDVALIAGASLGIPLAAHIKSLGKPAIALGGHLQVLFGLAGRRWRDNPEWRDHYITGAWIDVPARYTPKNTWGLVDDGAYW